MTSATSVPAAASPTHNGHILFIHVFIHFIYSLLYVTEIITDPTEHDRV